MVSVYVAISITICQCFGLSICILEYSSTLTIKTVKYTFVNDVRDQFHRIFISGQVTLDDNFNKEFAF